MGMGENEMGMRELNVLKVDHKFAKENSIFHLNK